jgi:hypothetical protein
VLLATRFPDSEAVALAAIADRHVFGPGGPTDQDIADYWADVQTVVLRMRKATPWWRRGLAAVSPASIPWREIAGSAAQRVRGFGARVVGSGSVQRSLASVRRLTERKREERNRA